MFTEQKSVEIYYTVLLWKWSRNSKLDLKFMFKVIFTRSLRHWNARMSRIFHQGYNIKWIISKPRFFTTYNIVLEQIFFRQIKSKQLISSSIKHFVYWSKFNECDIENKIHRFWNQLDSRLYSIQFVSHFWICTLPREK